MLAGSSAVPASLKLDQPRQHEILEIKLLPAFGHVLQ